MYYNIVDDELNQLDIVELNAQTFIDYGNDTLPDASIILTLDKVSVLFWADDTTTMQVLSANISATPLPQDVISGHIDTALIGITGIESVVIEDEGNPLYAVSFDSKQSWQMIVDDNWITISDEHNGMTKDVMVAITTSQWAEKVNLDDGIYIRFSLFNITDKVIKITTNFTN